MDDKLINEILKTVELETGINRLDFIFNSRKLIFLEARKKATKLLIDKAQLSDEGIAKVLGVSRRTANTYRISLCSRRRS